MCWYINGAKLEDEKRGSTGGRSIGRGLVTSAMVRGPMRLTGGADAAGARVDVGEEAGDGHRLGLDELQAVGDCSRDAGAGAGPGTACSAGAGCDSGADGSAGAGAVAGAGAGARGGGRATRLTSAARIALPEARERRIARQRPAAAART